MYALLLLLVPTTADHRPEQPAYFVNVDVIVVNRVRSFNVEFDAWGRPRYKPNEVWWVSFWDELQVTLLPIPNLRIDRGWWPMSKVLNITHTTDGWLFESTDGVNVIAPVLLYVDSPFDWEMRNRRIYIPIRKP